MTRGHLPEQDSRIAAPAMVGALIEGLIGPLAPDDAPTMAVAARGGAGATLFALRALGVVDARARGLVAQMRAAGGRDQKAVRDLLLLPLGIELREIGPQVARFSLVLDAGEDHLGAGNLAARILDVFEEHVLVPGDAGILVGLGIAVTRRCVPDLRPSRPLSTGPTLFLAPSPTAWQGRHFLNDSRRRPHPVPARLRDRQANRRHQDRHHRNCCFIGPLPSR